MSLNKCKVSQGINIDQTICLNFWNVFQHGVQIFTNSNRPDVKDVLSGCNRILTIKDGKLMKICPFCNRPLDWGYINILKMCPKCHDQYFSENQICENCEPATKLIERNLNL